jgi:hypothetical protein
MIAPEDYRLPHADEQQPKKKADPKVLEYLERLPFRPFTCEW